MMVVYPENVAYHAVQAGELREILELHVKGGTPVTRLVYEPTVKGTNKKPGH